MGRESSKSPNPERESQSQNSTRHLFFFLFKFCFFIVGCPESLLLPAGFSLAVASRGYSQVAGLGLLNAVASLSEHRLGCSWASAVAAHGRSSCGTRAAQHVDSSRTRDGTRVSCIGRQILYHRATREAPQGVFKSCHESPMGGRAPAERWECASSLSPVFLLSGHFPERGEPGTIQDHTC